MKTPIVCDTAITVSVIPYFAAFSEQGGLLFRSGQGDSCFSTMIQSGRGRFVQRICFCCVVRVILTAPMNSPPLRQKVIARVRTDLHKSCFILCGDLDFHKCESAIPSVFKSV